MKGTVLGGGVKEVIKITWLLLLLGSNVSRNFPCTSPDVLIAENYL